MHKIDTETAGENNTFVDSDPTATPPIEGTGLNAAFFNTLQEELCNIVTGFGGTLDNSEGFQNNSQILEVLKRIGVKCGIWATGDNTSNDVDTSDFDGHYVIFHSAESFTIGALKNGSVVIVIPYWGGDNAPDSINVDYKTSSNRYTINKGQMLIGVVGNGTSSYYGAQLVARYMPVLFGTNSKMIVGDIATGLINATALMCSNISANIISAATKLAAPLIQCTKFVDTGFVHFDSSDATSWMLKTEWEENQVKRVYRDDANTSGTGYSVNVPYDSEGNVREVFFRQGSYVEFMCVGYCNIGGTDFAVLLNNGYRY